MIRISVWIGKLDWPWKRGRLNPDNRGCSVSDGGLLGSFLAQVIDREAIQTEFVVGADADSVPGFSDDSVLDRSW